MTDYQPPDKILPIFNALNYETGQIGQNDIRNGYVDLVSNQTIAGNKNFVNPIYLTQNANQQQFIYDTGTSSPLLRFNNSNNSIGIGLNSLATENLSGNRSNVSIGVNALQNNDLGRYSVAIGTGALQAQTGTAFAQTIGIGYLSNGSTTGTDNICCGAYSGSLITTGSKNICIGTGADFDSSTQYNQSCCIGWNSKISSSNQLVLATATETTYIPGQLQVRNQYIVSCAPLSTGTTLTISAPIYQVYPLAPTLNMVVSIPVADASLLGVQINFRRTGGTTTTTITSTQPIYPSVSLTTTTTIMGSGSYTLRIFCTYITATTYGWVML